MYNSAIMQIGIYRGYRNGTNRAVANGKYYAIGDHVKVLIALADTKATGSVYQNIGELTKKKFQW